MRNLKTGDSPPTAGCLHEIPCMHRLSNVGSLLAVANAVTAKSTVAAAAKDEMEVRKLGDRKVPPVQQDDNESSCEVIIKISPWAPPDEVAAIREKLGATLLETTKSLKMELWSVPEKTLPRLIVMDGRSDLIEYVELNSPVRVPPIGGGRADGGHRTLLSTGEMSKEHADAEVGASMVAAPGAHPGLTVTNTGVDGGHFSFDWDFLV